MDVLNDSAVNVDDFIAPFGDEVRVEEIPDKEVDDDDADEEVDDDVTEVDPRLSTNRLSNYTEIEDVTLIRC